MLDRSWLLINHSTPNRSEWRTELLTMINIIEERQKQLQDRAAEVEKILPGRLKGQFPSKLIAEHSTQIYEMVAMARADLMPRVPNARIPLSGEYVLRLFLSTIDRETIPGDLDEEFHSVIAPKFGRSLAWIWYWWQVVRTIAYRNLLCRWVLIGGGILKIGEWLSHKIGG